MRGGALITTYRYGPRRPPGVRSVQPSLLRDKARTGEFWWTRAAGTRSSSRRRLPWRPILELYVVAPEVGSGGNASAKVCRIERADTRSASAREHPMVAVIHGYSTSALNAGSRGSDTIHSSTVVSQASPSRTACRASWVKEANPSAVGSVSSGRVDVNRGGPPPVIPNTHRLPGDTCVWRELGFAGS